MTMAVDYAHTGPANSRRAAKAADLAAALVDRNITYLRARKWAADERRVAELMAGVPRCSDETWAAVLSILRGVRAR